MPEMISKTVHAYADRALEPGDRFVAQSEDVIILLGLDRAELAPQEAVGAMSTDSEPELAQLQDLSRAKPRGRRKAA
jgi:hypothetical protein